MVIEAQTRQFEFYTPTPIQKEGDWVLPENLRGNKAFDRLVEKCLKPFQVDAVKRIGAFIDGGEAPSPLDRANKEVFTEEARKVIGFYATDFIKPDGAPDPKFSNLEEIAPDLIRIMTSPDNHIDLVQKVKALNIVAAALQMAIDPNAQMSIRVGIGGSDDQFTPTRFASYGLPAFMIAEGIQQFFITRREAKLTAVAVATELEKQELTRGESFSKEDKKEVSTTIRAKVAAEGAEVFLSQDQYQQAVDRYCLSDKTPKVQFVFATHASIAINGTHKNPELIPLRALERKAILQEFTAKFFPNLSPHVEFLEDIAWDQLNSYTSVTMEYFAHLVKTSSEPEVIKARDKSIERSQKHSGKSGEYLGAILYDVMHPLAFGDPIDLPQTNYLGESPKASDIAVTLGGKPEREYCVLREYIERVASADSYVAYLKNRIAHPQEYEDLLINRAVPALEAVTVADLDQVCSKIEHWRDKEGLVGSTQMIVLISTIGDFPPYFADQDYDLGYGASLEDNIALLDSRKTKVLQIADPDQRRDGLIPIHGRLVSLQAQLAEQSKRVT